MSSAASGPSAKSLPDTPTQEEWRHIHAGEPVHRERFLTHADQRYLGAVSFQRVKARPESILAAMRDVDALVQVLPKTKRATLIERSDGKQRIELVQGNKWLDATYTMFIADETHDSVRFWLDPTRPHGIADAWGFVRAQPIDDSYTLLTVGLAVDIGSGLVRMLFADAIQRVILSTPGLVQRYAERVEAKDVRREALLQNLSIHAIQ